MKERIVGLDLARAIAIFGMVIVNYKIAMSSHTGSEFLIWFSGLFEGRASALFVILAGIGIALLTQKAIESGLQQRMTQARLSLVKRGLLLIVIGLLYTPIWEADILHFYGFYFLIAAIILTQSNAQLLLTCGLIVFTFPVLMLFFDYEQGWNWSTLTYQDLWTLEGMFRHIIYNGFHPVFPWSAFLVFGIWLGRQNLSDRQLRKKLLLGALGSLLLTEGSFYWIRAALGDGGSLGMNIEEVGFLFSTSIIPPLPQYIVSAGSSAVLILLSCLYLAERFAMSRLINWLVQTGKMSLTLYVAHVIVGMGVLESIGLLYEQTIDFAFLSASIFCCFSVIFSVIWLKSFQAGPLEIVFRRLISR